MPADDGVDAPTDDGADAPNADAHDEHDARARRRAQAGPISGCMIQERKVHRQGHQSG